MRVIAGTARGRPLLCPPGRGTRPTPDRVREALFSILGDTVRGARVLDLFAGTGALGIEALSRGAERAVFVESDRGAVELLRRNLAACGLDGRALVVAADASVFLRGDLPAGTSLVFADPPYEAPEGPEALSTIARRAKGGRDLLVVYQHSSRRPPGVPDGMAAADRRRYGETGLLFLRLAVSSAPSAEADSCGQGG